MKLWQGLRNRIVMLAIGAGVLLFAVVLAVFEVIRRGEAAAALAQQAAVISDAIGELVGEHVLAGNKDQVESRLGGLVSRGQVLGVVVLDAQRRVLAAEPRWLRKEGRLVVWPGDNGRIVKLELRGFPASAHFQPLLVREEMAGGIWLVLNREPMVAADRRFFTVALLLLVGLVGVCMVLATIGAEGLVRPLEELGETVAALGRGELATRHEVRGPEELARLARRVNRMAEQLEASQAALSRLAADLDRQVRERTRELEESSRRFAAIANTDPLTGLTNRRGLEIELDRYLSLSRRNQQPLAVIMMDLDNFKTYNDRCGHLSGDTVLKAVAAALRGRARASDVVARWGGDEFCLLIPATDPDGALAATRRFVIAVLEAMADLSRADVSAVLGASAGVACYPEDGEEASELIARADAALYKVKASGGSGVLRASPQWAET
ncbi:MAG TPA: diguanylate cyclase [Thermoanaerobaculaceae bacterium]|nr:diguanylate cyclase [Thermoanaerobaculaceae bacterium]HRS14631.1 diguanylate cyclase [Thermoanaerobaculaceae bacterium]